MERHTLTDDHIRGLAWKILRVRMRLCSASLCGFEYESDKDIQEAKMLVERHVGGLEKQEFLLDLDTPPWGRRNT